MEQNASGWCLRTHRTHAIPPSYIWQLLVSEGPLEGYRCSHPTSLPELIFLDQHHTKAGNQMNARICGDANDDLGPCPANAELIPNPPGTYYIGY